MSFNKHQKGKELPLGLGLITDIAKVSDSKVYGNSNLKFLTPEQMLQRVPIALAQIKADNTS